MPILHPIFILIFLILAVGSYTQLYRSTSNRKLILWVVGIILIIAVGLRTDVGADYPVYRQLYVDFSLYIDYSDVFNKAVFSENGFDIEWMYVLINKILFQLGLPFYFVTLVMAIITISLKFTAIAENVEYTALAALFYFMPIMFFEDSGQMRQGIGIAISVFSFRYIKQRNLWKFLLFIYIALGFHKTSIVFLPAYWLVRIPMNQNRIFWVLAISLLLSPLELYRVAGSFFEGLTPQDVSSAYTGYLDDHYYGTEVETGLNDIVKLFYIGILIRFDKSACREVWYYEYMRNLGVFGLALFYFFRSNEIFAVRLPGAYMFFLLMFCMPSIVYAERNRFKNLLYAGFMTYFTMMFFYFGKGNGEKGRFTTGRYQNVLLKLN